MRKLPKLMILGHGRHGKDFVCEYLASAYGFKHVSSSRFVGEHAVWPHCQSPGSVPHYSSFEECYEDRHNHRALWFDRISEYNAENPARLGQELFKSYDIYCGLRSAREFHALRNGDHFVDAIWIDRSTHAPPESRSSCTVEQWMCNWTIDNNGSKEETMREIDRLLCNVYGLEKIEVKP